MPNENQALDTKNDLIEKLARAFAKRLKHWLMHAEFLEVVARNKKETNPQVCHSHDFVDANEAMIEAYEEVIGPLGALDDPEDAALWNGAWLLAARASFWAE